MTTREHPHLATAAPWADEPLGPARRRQVLKACLLAREPLLELHDRAREVWPGHRRTVEPSPDGTGYAQPAKPCRLHRTHPIQPARARRRQPGTPLGALELRKIRAASP